MKKFLLIFLMLISIKAVAQDFSDREKNKISSFGINFTELNLENSEVVNDLQLIIKNDRKRNVNRIWGIIFTAASVVTVTSGVLAIASSQGEPLIIESLVGVWGAIVIGAGILEGVISIPFHIAAGKRKRQRNKLILKYGGNLEK